MDYISFESELNKTEENVLKVGDIVKQNLKVFDNTYKNEQDLFFKSLQSPLSKILNSFAKVKKANSSSLNKALSIKLIEKIIFDYLLWLEKLENAVLYGGKDEAILSINIELELEKEIIKKFKKSDSSLFPLVSTFGLGYFFVNN